MEEEIIKKYREACYNSQNGCNTFMDAFKNEHPNEYKIITGMYRKRVSLKDTLDAFKLLGYKTYWITLTFKNSKDANKIDSKRKDAIRFLNTITKDFLLVEEFGEDNGRYHLHGFLFVPDLPFIEDNTFELFKTWHSRQKIELLEDDSKYKKKVRYLTNYSTKANPRIRRSKQCSRITNIYKLKKGLIKSFERTGVESYINSISKLIFNI